MKKLYVIHFTNAYGEECRLVELNTSKKAAKENFKNWMPEGKFQKAELLPSSYE